MRMIALVLISAIACCSTLPAQAPKGPPAIRTSTVKLDPANSELDRHLVRWEEEMQKVKTFAAQCSRVEKNPVFETTDRYQGTIHFMKPSNILLHMAKKGDPNVYDRFVCTGNFLYQYVPAQKEVHVYQTPNARPGQQKDDNSLAFLFGMKAKEAKRRYDLKLAKTDKWYVYVDITPRFPVDRAEFQKARVVLSKDTMMPRQLWFKQPNKEEVLWDFPKIKAGVELDKRHFTTPKLPKGWKMVQKKLPTAPQNRDSKSSPRVIREQNP